MKEKHTVSLKFNIKIILIILFLLSLGIIALSFLYNKMNTSKIKEDSNTNMKLDTKTVSSDASSIKEESNPMDSDQYIYKDYYSDKKKDSKSNTLLTVQNLQNLDAASIVDASKLDMNKLSTYFYSDEISDKVYHRIYGYSYKKDCTIDLKELRYVRVLYYGFDKNTHIGELIVNPKIADDICNIMLELYEAKYPIERMELIDNYKANDEASMAANNSSSFNYRTISGTTKLSNHSKGLAIDINPLYNPYVKKVDGTLIISPIEAYLYVDRSIDSPYLITDNDICYKTFAKYGFTWGGDWKSLKDYQHFEKAIE